ncbi:T9SS type A sorting domain-containing protein [Flammeovirga sp. EKP202]|uniref:T9SS type A sorting domain-containing protein n=1 Tax=Flammeovirga sp. EKP202 TaxID=2770592 RepID=UPI00165EF3DB|nr:T9SS type A sorting domain-containing protein [Flammeovirga sp. EKP202]MBD0401597.1 T9SS type A sorting domain-containing protein [Flammeovirga sp. EKP202]
MKQLTLLIIFFTLVLGVNSSKANTANSDKGNFTISELNCKGEIQVGSSIYLKFNKPNTSVYYARIYELDSYSEKLISETPINKYNDTSSKVLLQFPYVTSTKPVRIEVSYSGNGKDEINLKRTTINYNLNVYITNQSELNSMLTYKNDRVKVKYRSFSPSAVTSFKFKSLSPHLTVYRDELILNTNFNSSLKDVELQFESEAINACGEKFVKVHKLKLRPPFEDPDNVVISKFYSNTSFKFTENNTDREGTVQICFASPNYGGTIGFYQISKVPNVVKYTDYPYTPAYKYYMIYSDNHGNHHRTPYYYVGSNARTRNTAVEENITFSTFPNPVTSVLNVSYPSEGEVVLKIHSINGIEVKSKSFISKTSVDVADLDKGIYILSIDGQSSKFVKQ